MVAIKAIGFTGGKIARIGHQKTMAHPIGLFLALMMNWKTNMIDNSKTVQFVALTVMSLALVFGVYLIYLLDGGI